jgi:hypothetical protein
MPRRSRSPLPEPEAWHVIAISIDQNVAQKKMTKVMRLGFFGNCLQQRPWLGARACRLSSVNKGQKEAYKPSQKCDSQSCDSQKLVLKGTAEAVPFQSCL